MIQRKRERERGIFYIKETRNANNIAFLILVDELRMNLRMNIRFDLVSLRVV